MIQITDLYKSYGHQKVLENINLTFADKKIYGLLGRNGIGKSTLLNIISTQIPASSGSVLIDGENPFSSIDARSKVNMVKEGGFGVNIKVGKILDYAKMYYPNWDEEFKERLVTFFHIPTNKKYSSLSRGNKTMVGFIIGLASRSPYTFFDEPSLGLDAANRYDFYNLLLEDYEKHPRCIIISTHLIDEVTNLFEEVVMLKNSKEFIQGEVSELLSQYSSIQGRAEDVDSFLNGKKVLATEHFGSSKIAYIEGSVTEEERALLSSKNVTEQPISLQKLFVLLTQEGENNAR
ncbi:ATP-binding cassette domain-containing protein [Guggenheimella bovis]